MICCYGYFADCSFTSSIKTRIETLNSACSVSGSGESSFTSSIKTRIETPFRQPINPRTSHVLLHLPLKQGLKQGKLFTVNKLVHCVLLHLPLKQGLKLICSCNSSNSSRPVLLHLPLKQGLKLRPIEPSLRAFVEFFYIFH